MNLHVNHFWMRAGDVPDANTLQGKIRLELQEMIDNHYDFC